MPKTSASASRVGSAPPAIAWAMGNAPGVAHVVDRALAFERSARWPDAGAMRGAVREAYRAIDGAGCVAARITICAAFSASCT